MSESHDRSSASHADASGIDVLSDVLRSVRLTGAMLFLVDASAPWHSWAPRTEAFRQVVLPGSQHMISYHVVAQGRAWAGLQDAEAVLLEAGDVLVIAHGDAYYLADPASAPASYGPREAVEFFRQMAAGELPSTVEEGSGGATRAQFICGFLGCDLHPFNPVLGTLPPMLHVRRAAGGNDRIAPLIEFAQRTLREPRRAGSEGVLLRLAELMFVEVLRRHLESLSDAHTGWLSGLRDPLVARALARLHAQPEYAWTLEALANAVGSSRSVLADRFTQRVGQPPMHYLTQWRMQLAARLLAGGGAKLRAVADAVGYESEAAFSRAFKKAAGSAPAQWRQRPLRSIDVTG
jgi:AraC-like DNA-binding protein